MCNSVCARLLGAFEFGVGNLLVVYNEFPLDEGVAAELLFTIVLRRLRGLAGNANGFTDQPLRPNQLDPDFLQL